MIEISERSESNRGAPLAGQLELSFALRQKRQFSSKLRSGEEALVRLPRGPILRGGDLLRTSDGALIEVIAAPESLVRIEANHPSELARLAYHLGNRHVATQVGDGFLRIARTRCSKTCCLALEGRCTAWLPHSNPRRALTPMATSWRRDRPTRPYP